MKLRTILLGAVGVVAIAAAGMFAVHKLVMEPRFEAMQTALANTLMEFDADKDGKLSRPEVDAALAARFTKADTNGDGELDKAEFNVAAQELRGKFPEMPFHHDPSERLTRAFNALDWNRDGGLEPDELKGVVEVAAGFADRNNDGFISVDEIRKPWRHGDGNRQTASLF